MKRWYWYVAKQDELMIDLDGRTLLEIALKRIDREWGLDQVRIFTAPSNSKEHFHLVVRFPEELQLNVLQRMVFQLYFMDHTYRSVKNLFRAIDGVRAPSLLISPHKWDWCQPWRKGFEDKFWRGPDAMCTCKVERHKNPTEIKICPAHIKLRG